MHRDGDWHAALHVWVLTTAYGRPEVVLQRRSASKDTWPGRLDVAVGGHVRSGERLDETLRECEEEIGLTVAPADLAFLGRRTVASRDGGVDDREHQDVYAVVVDRTLVDLVLHPEEVAAVVRLGLDEAAELLVHGREASAVERARESSDERAVRLRPDELVPGTEGYYGAALVALRGLAAGQPVEPFATAARTG